MNKYKMKAIFFCLILTVLSCKKDTISYNPVLPSQGLIMILQGISSKETGENAANSVFVDFSKDVQNTVLRSSWDLGFYTGGADSRVILNHSRGATAVQLTDKSDLTTVSSADSVAVSSSFGLGTANFNNIDPVAGLFADYVKKTVIQVAANDADNKVYLISPGIAGGLGTDVNNALTFNGPVFGIKVKFKLTQNGYSVTYGRLNDLVFRTINVVRDPSYNFKYMSFSSSTANVEPGKKYWDIQWGWSTYRTASKDGNSTLISTAVPDFVLINFGANVTARQIIFQGANANSSTKFEDFGTTDLDKLDPVKDFSAERDAIGDKWRNTDASVGIIAVYTDRYYIVHDADGNYYKLRFTKFNTSDGGARGKPVIEYKLVKAFVNPIPGIQ